MKQEKKVRFLFRLWGNNKQPKEIAYRMKKKGFCISVRRVREYIHRIFPNVRLRRRKIPALLDRDKT